MIPSQFGVKVIDDSGVRKQFNAIQNLVDKCTEVVNCGDAGIEGEVIQRWVLLKARNKKPVKRLWISSLTEEAIKEGFESLKPAEQFDNLFAAGNCRAIGDWLLGINATRLYTLKMGKDRELLSIGRVQTPTLAMIVNRYWEINKFVSETYYELWIKYKGVEFSGGSKIERKSEADKRIAEVKESEFTITNFQKKKGKENPPKLFDLTSLQVEANKKHSYSADETLKLTQQLYEKKLGTYPRVDTQYLSSDLYPKIPGIMQKLTYYKRFTDEILKGKLPKSKNVFDDKKVTDHHAIIPTGVQPSGINPAEQHIYDMITRRFLAVFFPACEISNTTVNGQAGKSKFKATGKQILSPGWKVVYQEDGDFNKKDKILPEFEKGESGPHEPLIKEKQTSPPKYYSEATLLRAMETAGKQVDNDELREMLKDNGIGRPSTRANIIETLFKRSYIEKKRKSIYPTEKGLALIGKLDNQLLKSPELTGRWEKKLREIEKGELAPDKFKSELIEMVMKIVNEVKSGKRTIYCPACKDGVIRRGKSAFGCSNYAEDGCNFLIPFELDGNSIDGKKALEIIMTGIYQDEDISVKLDADYKPILKRHVKATDDVES